MTAALVQDVVHRRAPWWLAALLRPEEMPVEGASLFLTAAQRRQTSAWLISEAKPMCELSRCACSLSMASPATVQPMLTHSRNFRPVHSSRGDVALHVDTTDFLSWQGLQLTPIAAEQELLTKRTRDGNLTSPFWVTAAEVSALYRYQSLHRRFGFRAFDSEGGTRSLHDPSFYVELTCGAPTTRRYINWSSICCNTNASLAMVSALSFFRRYAPINVRTRRRFPASVELRLRVEAAESGCWCSIWGTAEDYTACGFTTLDGALGVDVFDDLGNPFYLIHALCTTTPLDVYAACYPSDSICRYD